MASYNSPATSRLTENRFAGVLHGFGWSEFYRCMCGGSLKISYRKNIQDNLVIFVRPSKGVFYLMRKGRYVASGHENKLETTLIGLTNG
jgi:hypothetical protein